jgi:hypothetical protein
MHQLSCQVLFKGERYKSFINERYKSFKNERYKSFTISLLETFANPAGYSFRALVKYLQMASA